MVDDLTILNQFTQLILAGTENFAQTISNCIDIVG